jgi:hypothetical protein
MTMNDAAKFVLKERNRRLAEKVGLQQHQLEELEKSHEPEHVAAHLIERGRQRREKVEKLLQPEHLERAKKVGLTHEKVTALLEVHEKLGHEGIERKIEAWEEDLEGEDTD